MKIGCNLFPKIWHGSTCATASKNADLFPYSFSDESPLCSYNKRRNIPRGGVCRGDISIFVVVVFPLLV